MANKKRISARERSTKQAKLKENYGKHKKGDTIEFNESIEKELKKKNII